jgi:hypothetical protein
MFSIATPLGAGTFVYVVFYVVFVALLLSTLLFLAVSAPVLNFLLKTIALVLLKLFSSDSVRQAKISRILDRC